MQNGGAAPGVGADGLGRHLARVAIATTPLKGVDPPPSRPKNATNDFQTPRTSSSGSLSLAGTTKTESCALT